MTELKCWCAVRTDLGEWYKEFPGKLAAQAGHGFVSAIVKSMYEFPETTAAYMQSSQAKIVLRAKESDFARIARECHDLGIPCVVITDEGRTVFDKPTKTVIAFGPAYSSDLSPYLKRLRLL